MKLTPTEIQVVDFIKHVASSKDIAEALALPKRTVETHRLNIRKRLRLSGRGSNLRTYLSPLA
jgi:DNA-binding NarL/FixJ family response regulator